MAKPLINNTLLLFNPTLHDNQFYIHLHVLPVRFINGVVNSLDYIFTTR